MIVSISGKKHSGKDTLAKMWKYLDIKEENPDRTFFDEGERKKEIPPERISIWKFEDSSWQTKKWATKLKQVAALILGIDPEKFEDPQFKKQKMHPRWKRYRVHYTDGYFADSKLFPTKEQAEEFGKEGDYERYEIEEEIPTYRQFLQEIGTEAFRDVIHPNTWVNALMTEYEQNIEQEVIPGVSSLNSGEIDTIYPQWLITDTRFPNEFRTVENAPGQTYNIRIERDVERRLPNLWKQFLGVGGKGPVEWDEFIKENGLYKTIHHPSETALDDREDWDYVITNNGTLKQLFKKVKILKETVLKV